VSVDSWQPVNKPSDVSPEQISQLVALAEGQPKECDLTLELEFIQPLAHLDKQKWEEIALSLTQDKQKQLICLLTLAEQQGNWHLAERSPVIALFKVMSKQHGIDKSLVQWVKAHTENKFLPFGPLL